MPNPNEIIKEYFLKNKFCLAHNQYCDEVISAHSISLMHLKNIAEDSNVIMPLPSLYNQECYEFKEVHINKATTFTGFCGYHDNVLFKSFEQDNTFIGMYKQIFDLSLRVLSREYFQKKCLSLFYKKLKTGEISLDNKEYLNSEHYLFGYQHLMKELIDLRFLRTSLLKLRIKGLMYIFLKTTKLPIATTGVLFPLSSPSGKALQKKEAKQLGFIYSILPLQDYSIIILSTVKKKNVSKEYLSSIYQLVNQPDFFINFLLSYFFHNNDNIALKPSWYSTIPENFQNQVIRLMNNKVGQNGMLSTFNIIDFYNEFEFSIIKTKSCF